MYIKTHIYTYVYIKAIRIIKYYYALALVGSFENGKKNTTSGITHLEKYVATWHNETETTNTGSTRPLNIIYFCTKHVIEI